MTDRVFNVLFLCTGNSARSILAESALNKLGEGRFRGYSAGSFPKGAVNPDALRLLERIGYPTEGLHSKSWEEFSVPDAPVMDFVFTVCDDAAGETCPVWPGHPMTAHWGIEDPSHVEGNDIERERAFVTALRYLENRIKLFMALPFDQLDVMALRAHVREIGQGEGASNRRGDAA
ncbi:MULTISPECIES: arsenate reductase ArsC [Sphingomonadaceae]|jgi:arsenate reductase|uniref:Arsenate reductase ArsC n=3 Tax=Sphingomonadaceae TaxID=41297 RepID=A0ABT5WYC4_9SPHN|nr:MULTISPECIES: arsenate reductase ArsC [Sphingomonadaceae]MCF8708796.1 arsenate reductase ArsC [Rhizorhapis sp. SPR117]ATE65169.1 ArsR family transcriptional regulator [Rhizorhabdus dicambivorans]ATE65247.1 ArsR family transcriptional regulator [Rhizorhabdus dicambivorans]ATE65683.1 ArsR family transcriptional regulator [Rhizorhabdus dicambivorans]ATE66048.1 ArsR family transcriptional regulator [Rhizorhabdus dicambivorans]